MFSLFLFSYLAFSQPHWVCTGKEISAKDQPGWQIMVDINNHYVVLKNDSEEIEVVTLKNLSRWKYPKEKCQTMEQRTSNQWTDSYELTYNCSNKVRGQFFIDIRNRNAFYREELFGVVYERHIYDFNSCQQ